MLDLVPEEDNPRDPNAVEVMVPILENIVQEWREREEQCRRIQDMAGLMVDLCNVVSIGLRIHHSIRHATCFVTGEIVQGGPVVGGDPQLRAIYLLELDPQADIRLVADNIHRHIDADCRMFL